MRTEYGVCEECGNHGICLDGLCVTHHQKYQDIESVALRKELAGSTETDQAFDNAKKGIQALCDILLLKEQNESSLSKTIIGAAGNVLINSIESMREFDK